MAGGPTLMFFCGATATGNKLANLPIRMHCGFTTISKNFSSRWTTDFAKHLTEAEPCLAISRLSMRTSSQEHEPASELESHRLVGPNGFSARPDVDILASEQSARLLVNTIFKSFGYYLLPCGSRRDLQGVGCVEHARALRVSSFIVFAAASSCHTARERIE